MAAAGANVQKSEAVHFFTLGAPGRTLSLQEQYSFLIFSSLCSKKSKETFRVPRTPPRDKNSLVFQAIFTLAPPAGLEPATTDPKSVVISVSPQGHLFYTDL